MYPLLLLSLAGARVAAGLVQIGALPLSSAVKDPRGVLGISVLNFLKDTEIRVWDSTAEIRYLVLPMRPAGTEGWSEQRLAELVTRDSMIGTGLPKRPDEAS